MKITMLRVLFLLFMVLPAMLGAQSFQDRFVVEQLSSQERRVIQAALALEGQYLGLIDGKWGKRSAFALIDATGQRVPRYDDVAPILRRFEKERISGNWTPVFLEESNLSFVVPLALFAVDRSTEHATLATPGRSLVVRSLAELQPKTKAMHDWVAASHRGPTELYQISRGDQMVSVGILETGKRVYLRSDRRGDIYISILVQSDPVENARAALISASIRAGDQAGFALPQNGLLHRLVSKPLRKGDAPENVGQSPRVQPPRIASDRPKADVSRPPIRGTGTGFFVNTTDIVTAAHVTDGCGSLLLEDGTTLTLLTTDKALDLAVVSANRRSPVWLPLTLSAAPKLGEPVFALGYPFYGTFDQGVSVTGGNVSALPKSTSPNSRVMISAPVQPGNSGGPLLNDAGEVVGVVVSRASDAWFAKNRGSLPENMNFAVPTAPLIRFLNQSNILFPTGTTSATKLSAGVPKTTQDSVVTILCY